MKIKLAINGELYEEDVAPSTSLSELLRDMIGLTGTKRGCDSGGCGMCTVVLDGKAVYSCMTPAWRAEGSKVETVEGLQKNGKYHPLQEAFIRLSAPQCGYCTSGMLMAAKALLDSRSSPTEDQIRDGLCGVLCRCTGYIPYLNGIRQVIEEQHRQRPSFASTSGKK